MDDTVADGEDSFELVSKTWKKAINTASQIGYTEGKSDGSLSVFQIGFDKGYKEAFQPSFILGVYKGLSKYLTDESDHPKEIQNIISDTKKGICYLCHLDLSGSKNASEDTIPDIQSCQKEHTEKTLKILLGYFEPRFKEKDIDIQSFSFLPS